MTRAPLLLCLLASACLNADVERKESGVAVGNPGEMTARVAAGGDLTLTDAWLGVAAIELQGCDGEVETVAQDIVFDLMGDPRVRLPAGTWCGLWVEEARLELAAEGASATVTIDLPLDVELESDSGFTLADGATLLQLGPAGWLSADALDLGDGANTIDDEDERADELVEALEAASLLVDDANADGARGADEAVLAAGEEAEDEPIDFDEDDEDDESTAGCGGGDAAVFLPLALLGLGRRRRAPWAPARPAREA